MYVCLSCWRRTKYVARTILGGGGQAFATSQLNKSATSATILGGGSQAFATSPGEQQKSSSFGAILGPKYMQNVKFFFARASGARGFRFIKLRLEARKKHPFVSACVCCIFGVRITFVYFKTNKVY